MGWRRSIVHGIGAASEKARTSFFEKKEAKKLSLLGVVATAESNPAVNESFLLLFFKKEVLSFIFQKRPEAPQRTIGGQAARRVGNGLLTAAGDIGGMTILVGALVWIVCLVMIVAFVRGGTLDD